MTYMQVSVRLRREAGHKPSPELSSLHILCDNGVNEIRCRYRCFHDSLSFSAIQTVRGNFSLRAISPLCRPRCIYGTSSMFQFYMWARRYSPTADNPGARLQKNNPVLSALKSICIIQTLLTYFIISSYLV